MAEVYYRFVTLFISHHRKKKKNTQKKTKTKSTKYKFYNFLVLSHKVIKQNICSFPNAQSNECISIIIFHKISPKFLNQQMESEHHYFTTILSLYSSFCLGRLWYTTWACNQVMIFIFDYIIPIKCFSCLFP